MIWSPPRFVAAGLAAGLILGAASGPALAKDRSPPTKPATAAEVTEIQSALDEQRLLDAGKLLDRAAFSGVSDPRLQIMNGELALARGRYDDALKMFRQIGDTPTLKARLMQDRGLALSMLDKSDEAFATLKQAVIEDVGAWRAWNALGGEYDRRRDWPNAEAAYDHALTGSNRAAIVLNNRGFSRVLQNRLDEGIADLVAALEKKPDLTAARTNLRLAMGLKGDYDRAVAAGPSEDKAALYNNVGYAALLRGDQARAEEFFNKAISARGEFYGRATNNLDMAANLKGSPPKDAGLANAKP